VALFLSKFRHSPGGTEENDKNLNQDSRSPGPSFEPETSRIQSSMIHSYLQQMNIRDTELRTDRISKHMLLNVHLQY
jgi:hypothetical protein